MERKKALCSQERCNESLPTKSSRYSIDYQSTGQPVLIPGDMGRCSYVLVGTERAMEETFGSTCHEQAG